MYYEFKNCSGFDDYYEEVEEQKKEDEEQKKINARFDEVKDLFD